MKTTITITGTHCKACKMLIEDVAHDVPGIVSCTVDFTTGKTNVEYEIEQALEALKKEINELGDYAVTGV